jgi:two-component system CheB/CheR fusion protein
MSAKNKKSAPDGQTALENAKAPKKGRVNDDFPIVAIGASAGGLETLQAFFDNMPADPQIAFVIIQHLSPDHKSLMAELLAKHTPMAVRQIEDGMRLLPGCVYLTPPDKNVAIFNRSLHLLEPIRGRGINMPIDFFFPLPFRGSEGKSYRHHRFGHGFGRDPGDQGH